MDRGPAAGRPVSRGRVSIAALVAAVVVGCAALPMPAQISIPPGVIPRTAPATIEALTLDLIHDMEVQAACVATEPRVLRMTLTDIADVQLVEPATAVRPGLRRGMYAWVVRAEGTFTNRRGRFNRRRPCAASGYVLFLDRDATLMGMGFP